MNYLDESIKENKDLSFAILTNKSHGKAWENAVFSLNEYSMAREGDADEDMVNYMKHMDKLKKSSVFSK
ncbi:hypothetical protein [Chryseobacterium sp. CT-SW4]|uniref:hypothetical protein n=1 Tax=Chryseobacterium sp. SW-1 TaxID=3157343 RepID=UPI003B025B55